MQIGANSCGSEQFFAGAIDEVSIWSRALSGGEILALYRRGALRLAIKVRSCAQADCADGLFVGPGGDPAASFDEETLGQPGPPRFLLSGMPEKRFFQYQVTMTADVGAGSPELQSVWIEAHE